MAHFTFASDSIRGVILLRDGESIGRFSTRSSAIAEILKTANNDDTYLYSTDEGIKSILNRRVEYFAGAVCGVPRCTDISCTCYDCKMYRAMEEHLSHELRERISNECLQS